MPPWFTIGLTCGDGVDGVPGLVSGVDGAPATLPILWLPAMGVIRPFTTVLLYSNKIIINLLAEGLPDIVATDCAVCPDKESDWSESQNRLSDAEQEWLPSSRCWRKAAHSICT